MKFTPPHSIEAEQALISCMLLEQRVAVQAVEELRTEDFYRETHKLIYGAIQEIVDKHQELNLVSLIDLLKLKGQLADAGDVAYITHLSMARPTTAGWKEFLRIVHEYATKRLLAKLGQTMAIRSQGEEAAESQVDEALEDLTEIATGTRERGFEDAETLVARTLDHITNRSEEEYYLGVPTSFAGLDDLTSGLQAGDLFILAARPSMGKTAFALNMVLGIVQGGTRGRGSVGENGGASLSHFPPSPWQKEENNMNKVTLMGRLVRDPELKETGNGKSYVRFTLAIDYAKDKEPTISIGWNSKGEMCEWDIADGKRGASYGRHLLGVHELQHALRLCGLNELADNFKV